jgi:hypothetical protein
MNNENMQKKRILRILLVSSQSSLSSLRSIRSALLVFLLIFTIIAITPLFISQDVDNNNNNIVNAQKQNNTLPALLLGNSNSSNNATIVNNDNADETTTTTTTTTTTLPPSISLPLSRGYVNGKIGYFIATDVSDNQTAIEISNNQRFKVNFAPSLALIPESSRQQGYEFLNGVKGQGAFGFQLPIASKLPADKDYSPIVQLNFVKWNNNNNSTNSDNAVNNIRELKSVTEIMAAQKSNELTITRTNILINSPAVSTSRYFTTK